MTNTTSLTRTSEIMYAIAWVVNHPAHEPDYDDEDVLREMFERENDYFEPEGWREHALLVWGDTPPEHERWPNGYKPFFWPSSSRLYTTRKAAEARRDLINRWGGSTVVVVAEIDWVPLTEMDAKWKRERLLDQRLKIDAELEELESETASPARLT